MDASDALRQELRHIDARARGDGGPHAPGRSAASPSRSQSSGSPSKAPRMMMSNNTGRRARAALPAPRAQLVDAPPLAPLPANLELLAKYYPSIHFEAVHKLLIDVDYAALLPYYTITVPIMNGSAPTLPWGINSRGLGQFGGSRRTAAEYISAVVATVGPLLGIKSSSFQVGVSGGVREPRGTLL